MMSQETTHSSTSSAKVSQSLKILGQLCEKREEELSGILTDAIHEESDEKNDSSFPIFDWFYTNGGLQALIEISNFNYKEFECLWHCCCTSLIQRLTTRRGRKSDVETLGLLFIVLCVLKFAKIWDLMGEIFDKKRPTLKRLFSHADEILSIFLYQECVVNYHAKLSMRSLIKKKAQLKHFPFALYATDLIF